jgi:hypothetical protein
LAGQAEEPDDGGAMAPGPLLSLHLCTSLVVAFLLLALASAERPAQQRARRDKMSASTARA